MSLPARSARGVWLAGLCWGLACGRTGEVHTEPLELARGPIQRTEPEPLPVSDEPAAMPDPVLPAADVEVDPRRAEVVAWLERECSGCHDSENPDARYEDLDVLFRSQLLWPEAAEISPLVLWLQYGSSRREHAGVQVSPEEFDTLVGYVNSVGADSSCPGYDVVDRDRTYELMALDIATREPADRPFIRYVGFARANESGVGSTCIDRAAFIQLLNGVSLGPTIVPPATSKPIELSGAFYVVDIRDYGWNMPVDVGGSAGDHFDDGWSAIVAAVGAESLELAGPEADVLKRETQTPIPFVTASQFVTAAAVGDLYYALVGIGDNVNPLVESLGVDDASLSRAGVFGAGGVQADRVVTRREQRAFPGHSWWTREELPNVDGTAGLARDPVRFRNEGGEVIFTLPNGLFAFAMFGSNGASVKDLPSCVGGSRCPTAVRAENSVTCRACHWGGVLGVTDEVMPYLDAERGRYPADLEPLIREQYRPDLLRALDADSGSYGAAAEAAGTGLYDVVARLYFEQTRRPLDARRLANELGVSIDQLRGGIEALGSSAPELAPLLSDGTIERGQLSPYLLPLSCSIAGRRNLPANCP